MSDGDFNPVTFEKEIEKIRSDLKNKPVQLSGLTSTQLAFVFAVSSISQDTLSLRRVSGPALTVAPKTPIEILFGLDDGQYLLQTEIVSVHGDVAVLDLKKPFLRLQRRRNFRAMVNKSPRVMATFVIDGKKVPLQPLDLSAGGMRVVWPPAAVLPSQGAALKCSLQIRDQIEFEVQMNVRSQSKNQSEIQLGLEFENLKASEQQALTAVCLQLRRENRPVDQ